ncbi:hypothetical protein CHCC20335_4072 [Bacillus paralicheniformis]|nr:hypothetical protein CHCC20335_4072 [Bacillus paralicheniformis]
MAYILGVTGRPIRLQPGGQAGNVGRGAQGADRKAFGA